MLKQFFKNIKKDCTYMESDPIHNSFVPGFRLISVYLFLVSTFIMFMLVSLGFKFILGLFSVLFLIYILYKFCVEYGKPKN